MSNVGQKTNTTRGFNPIITDITYNTLQTYVSKNISINVPNAFIISIPQANDADVKDAASIWMTDNDGYLLNITRPNSELDNVKNNSEIYKDILKQLITMLTASNSNSSNDKLTEILKLLNNLSYDADVLHNTLTYLNDINGKEEAVASTLRNINDKLQDQTKYAEFKDIMKSVEKIVSNKDITLQEQYEFVNNIVKAINK